MAVLSAIKLPNNVTYTLKDNGALQLTGGKVTGPVTFGDSVSIDDATIGNLVVNGNASFTNNIQANTINGVAVGSSPKFTDTNTVTTATTTGSGNAVTAITASNGALTVTKGSTFLTAHNTYSITNSGSGNAVTGVSLSGTTFTVTKGSTFLTSHQDISGKADKSATVSTVAYDSTNKKITKTINGTTSDVVTVATLKTALGSMPASDVYSWAKASTKPTYTASEVGALPSNTTYVSTITTTAGTHSAISSKSGAVSFNVPTKTSHLTNDSGFLTNSTLYEANLAWGGKNFSGSYGPIDAAMIGQLGANRFAFLKAEGLTIEYSTDGGSNWTDYGATNSQKVGLFGSGQSFYLGKHTTNGSSTLNDQLRVTIDTSKASLYTVLNKIAIYMSTSGNTVQVKIERALESTPTTFATHLDWTGITGWSGWNILNIGGLITYGNTAASQYGRVRFIFRQTAVTTTYTAANISQIMGFGGVGWTIPSNMARDGHLYSYDNDQNASFPAQVSATKFSGPIADSNNATAITFSYSKSGLASTSWLAAWNGYELRAISPSNVTAGSATTATTATTASNLSGFTNTTTTATAIDSATQNGHVYVNGTSGIYNQNDGAAFVQAYSASWVAQIYQDYRTGQIALRGRNNGTWQAWRKVIDSSNYTSLISMGSLSGLTKAQVTTALGYTPPTTNTNTTYTFANGTNGFTVTPSGGTAQTVTVTPSITNNITGSGTSGYIAKFNGAHTLTNGPAIGTGTTKFLREDGTWATPTAVWG